MLEWRLEKVLREGFCVAKANWEGPEPPPPKVRKGFQARCDLGLDLVPNGLRVGKQTALSVRRVWRTPRTSPSPSLALLPKCGLGELLTEVTHISPL